MKNGLVLTALGLLSLVVAGPASADDVSSLREELAILKAKVVGLDGARDSGQIQGDSETLTSMKKKGRIQIGGRVEIDMQVVSRDDFTSSSDDVLYTQFTTQEAELDFKISAGSNAYLFIRLDLDDFWDSTVNQDDLLEEVYFRWNQVRGSNWDLRFGKGELPYGQDKDVLITDSYHHNDGDYRSTYLGVPHEAVAAQGAGVGGGNPHLGVGNFAHPGEKDNVFLIEATYRWRDWFTFEGALFQNHSTTGGAGRLTRGMHEDRPDDHLLFQSVAGRFTLRPIEGLTLQLSGLNQHTDSQGDVDSRLPAYINGDAKTDESSISFSFDYFFRGVPLEIFGEYQHGANWYNDDHYTVDIFSLGTIWGVTPKIDLIAVGEWLNLDANNNNVYFGNGYGDEEDYYKLALGAKYKFDNGIYLMVEYLHEWYHNERPGDDRRDADALSFRTAWSF